MSNSACSVLCWPVDEYSLDSHTLGTATHTFKSWNSMIIRVNFLILIPENFGRCLLMPCLLLSPGHQQLWYIGFTMRGCLSSMMFSCVILLSWNDRKYKYILVSINLTHCGLVMVYMATEILINIGLGDGLVPNGTKPLPEPVLTYYW